MVTIKRRPDFASILERIRGDDRKRAAAVFADVTIPPEPDPLTQRGPSWHDTLSRDGFVPRLIVRIHVRDVLGNPVGDAELDALERNTNVRVVIPSSDPVSGDGYASLPVGAWTFRARKEGVEGTASPEYIVGTFDLSIVLELRTGVLLVTVVKRDVGPAAGVGVVVSDPDSRAELARSVTDAAGEVRFEVTIGEVRVDAFSGPEVATEPRVFVDVQGVGVKFVFPLAPQPPPPPPGDGGGGGGPIGVHPLEAPPPEPTPAAAVPTGSSVVVYGSLPGTVLATPPTADGLYEVQLGTGVRVMARLEDLRRT